METPKSAGQRRGLAAQAGVPRFGACWRAPPCGKGRQCRGQAPCPLDQPPCHFPSLLPPAVGAGTAWGHAGTPFPLSSLAFCLLVEETGSASLDPGSGSLRCCVTLSGSLTTLCLSFSPLQAGGQASFLFSACSLQTCRPEPYSHSCGRPVPEQPARAVSGAGGAGAPDRTLRGWRLSGGGAFEPS